MMARWRNHFFQLLNVHRVNDVRQTEIQTSELLVPEPSAFDFEMATEKPPPPPPPLPKKHKSQGTDKIPTELIKAGDRTIHSEIHKLITSIWNKEELPEERKESIIVSSYKKGNKTGYSDYKGISLLSSTFKMGRQTFV